MKLTFDWASIINIVGTVNGLFITIIILGIKKGKKTTNVILSNLVFTFTLIILSTVIWQTKLYYFIPQVIGIFPNFYTTLGPLLFFYVKALTNPRFSFKIKYLYHFIPFALNILYLLPYFLKNSLEKIRIFENLALHTSISYHVILVSRLIHLSIYLVLTVQLLKKHNRDIKKTYSSIEKVKLKWVSDLILALGSLLAAYVLFYVFSLKDYGSSDPFSLNGRIFSVWQTVIVFFIGYKGLVQTEIFTDRAEGKHVEKYQHSTLTEEQAEKHLKNLLKLMKEEKPYLDSELTIKELAKKQSISYFHLSQIINERLNQNFYDFINRYRVEEAKNLLIRVKEDLKYTILDAAFDSGFNSKSSFNLVFKKYVGMTPSQFIKKKNQIH